MLILGIHFRQAEFRLELHCRLGESRRHGAAGAAPRRPEIDQQGNVGAFGMRIKAGGIKFKRIALPDVNVSKIGSQDWLRDQFGMGVKNIVSEVREMLKK